MGKKLRTLLILSLGFSLGILTAVAPAGIFLYQDYAQRQRTMNKKKELIEEINRKTTQLTLEGSMLHELTDRISYLKTPLHEFDLDYADILKYHKGDNRLVVFIQDMHKDKDMQEKIYKTIDELRKENGVDLLVLENFPNEEVTKEKLYKIVDSLPHKIMSRVVYGFWMPKTEEDVGKVFDAGFAYEYNNKDKIKTYGSEDEEFHELTGEINSRLPKSKGRLWLHQELILDKRSETGVKNTVRRMETNGMSKAIFICGAGHTKGTIEILEEEGVSYLVLQPKGMDEKLRGLFGYYP